MKRIFLSGITLLALTAGSAGAADLGQAPVYKAPPPLAPAPFSWTGFYIGGNIGAAWADTNITDVTQGVSFGRNGNNGAFIGGGQVGFNYQFASNFVLGLEWDFDWAANNNNTRTGVFFPAVTTDTFAVSSNDRWITTVAARFGYAVDHWLFYGKAGGGWVGNNNFTITDLTTGASLTGTGNSSTNGGWLLGAGVEWAFANNWTAKLEYDYLELSSRTVTVPLFSPILAGDTINIGNNSVQEVKVGINYLFNLGAPGPVVSRY
jgi:outer membrane immunogenic protein